MVKTKQQLVSSRALTYPGVNGRKYITIHETANTDKGTGAQTHANLQTNGFTASWHWSVDDKEAIQSFPHTVRCWHAGDGEGKGNFNSIGIEICVNADGDFKQAVKNAAELVEMIMHDEGIPLSKIVQHNKWSGKNCPTNLRNGSKGINWSQFINMVSGAGGTTTVKPSKPQTKPETITKPASGSVVDYMKSKGMDASYSNREKLAKQYGISGYKGTASQNATLLSKIKAGKPKQIEPTKKGDMKTNSIVTYLNSIGANSSYNNRVKLAKQYGISNYKGTAAQNTSLLSKLRSGSSTSKAKGDQKTSSVVDYLKSINVNSSYTNRKKLAAKHSIKNYSGTAAQNAQLLKNLR